MKDTNTSQEPGSIWIQFGEWPIDNIRKWSRDPFEGGEEFVSASELAEANADCKRANELLNAAIDDFGAANAKADAAAEEVKLWRADAKTAWAECELLRCRMRSPLPPDVIAAAWGAWRSRHGDKLGPGPGFVEAVEAAIRKLGEKG